MKLKGGRSKRRRKSMLERIDEDAAEDRRVEGVKEGRLEGGGRNVGAGVDNAA